MTTQNNRTPIWSSAFLNAYRELKEYGQLVSPRGMLIKELENFQMTFSAYERFSSFNARELNLQYCIQEFLWYLRGDRFDSSITRYATMWKKLADVDGGYNSNYGQYIFSRDGVNQFAWVLEELVRDKFSRRAVMTLLNPSHLREDNVDVVCTYGLSFRIRYDALNMSVSMRSNDAIFGLTNDAFCFSMLHEMLYVALKPYYPDLILGTYTHKVDSFHVYERHFDMLDRLVDEGHEGYTHIDMPEAESLEDFTRLIDLPHSQDFSPFTKWVYNNGFSY